MKQGTLILLRHGQTKDNLKGILSGQNETDLSARGEKQGIYSGHLLSGIKIDKAYSSKLSRAFNTAALALDAAGQGHLRVEKRVELIETDLGDFTGLHYADPAVIAFGEAFDKRLPGGESPRDVVARVRDFYQDELLPRLNRGETVLVVAHAGVVSAFGVALGARKPEDPRRDIPNATPLVFEHEGGRVARSYKIPNPISSRQP